MSRSNHAGPPPPMFLGLTLVTVGLLLILRELGIGDGISMWSYLWLTLGGWLFIGTLAGGRRGWFWPLTLVLVGAFMVLRDVGTIRQDFAIWPIVVLAIGLAILLDVRTGGRHHRPED